MIYSAVRNMAFLLIKATVILQQKWSRSCLNKNNYIESLH